jgi:excisionase family DNA binding protein
MSIIENPRPLFSIDDAANYLGISRSSLYRLIKKGALPSVRLLKRKQLVARDALDEFILAQTSKFGLPKKGAR